MDQGRENVKPPRRVIQCVVFTRPVVDPDDRIRFRLLSGLKVFHCEAFWIIVYGEGKKDLCQCNDSGSRYYLESNADSEEWRAISKMSTEGLR